MAKFKRMFLLATPLLGVCSGFALAADLPKEGNYDHTTCFTRNSTRIDYAKTHFAYSYEETGQSVSNPPGGLFDDEVVHCVGVSISLDGKRSGSSLCQAAAKNGDTRLTHFWYDGDGKFQRQAVAGTGAYDGMVTTGSVKQVGPMQQVKPGTVKFCNQGVGTYKLK
ncbi:MAG: hypothetical protein KA141_07665 [Rubrivivax sp.]|jgi:hypothetical protein|nr:hypothetical protein [Rubrivivax sp.]